MDRQSVASKIDHTLLKPEATQAMIERLCAEAVENQFATVCVQPYWTGLAAVLFPRVAAVVGFPLGANLTVTKAAETSHVLAVGACEIDMVVNLGELTAGNGDAVERDIRAVVEVAHARGAITKVILETALLTDAQKRLGCGAAQRAGADYVKTSTGFGPGGATVEDVALLRAAVGAAMGVKASGGIRTWDDCRAMMTAGANRIGTSAGVAILEAIS